MKRRKVVRQLGSGASCLSQTGFSAGRKVIREDDGAQAFEFDDNMATPLST